MKKIYSIVLMAAALLVGTNVQAEKVATMTIEGVTTDVEDLAVAFNYVKNESTNKTATIVLVKDATFDLGVTGKVSGKDVSRLELNENEDITLDLAGKNLDDRSRINVKNAKLRIINTGLTPSTIDATLCDISRGSQPFNTYGVSATDATVDRDACYFLLGERVVLNVKSYGVAVMYIGTSAQGYLNYGNTVDIKGEIYASEGTGIATNGNMSFKIEGAVKSKCPLINIYPSARIVGAHALTPIVGDGSNKANPKTQAENVSKYYIAKGGTGKETHYTTDAAVYGPGYAEWNIKGYLAGGVGLYLKSGKYNIDGAEIHATSAEYWEPIAYSNGFIGAGSAIIFDANASYGGDITMAIEGETQVSSDAGYAIQDAKTTGTTTAVTGITITSGEFQSNSPTGDAITTTPELKDQIVANGSITGGTYNSDITEYLSNITGVITPVYNAETGKTTYVVADKETTDPWLTSLTGATATSYVRLTGGGNIELPADNVEMAYLVMQGDANKVTIKNGQTMTVGEIVLGPNAVIDVRGGGKLVVKGTNGIVANANSNIIIAAQEGSMGQFYLDPTVASNKNPHATVALTTKSYWNGDDYAYERMGVPAVDGMAIQDIVNVGGAPNVSGLYWDANATPQGWKQASKTQVLAPFTGIALISTSTTPGKQYNFPCRLVGNSDVPLSVVGQWTYFANSYMAELDLKALGTAILASGENVAATAFTDPEGKENWGSVSLESLKEGMFADRRFLKPMQGFILNNNSANPTTANVTVNYCAMVWDPVYNPTHQHKAARMSSDLIRAMITVTAENGREDAIIVRQSEEFSPAYDNGADVAQYMGLNAFDFYATTELGNMTEVASNDIDGLQLSVAAKEAGSYKMTFSYVLGEQLAIRDNLTGTTMTIAEGAEYYFSATEGTSNNRFEIVSVKNAPTDVETVVETEGAKAVYTVLGQYVGTTDNWSILPAGIYVIDGVKMVK